MQIQYNELKKQYSDCLLLYRLGDFYECFNDDAKTVSKVLGLTLTGRGENENRVPMAGIPHHALTTYLPKLIKAGFKIAIADQMEEPKPGQIVKRDVVKVVTAGTIVDENYLNDSENNYIGSIYVSKNRGLYTWGLAYADISTAEFKLAEFYTKSTGIPRELVIELFRIRAAELILPQSLKREISDLLPGITLFSYDDNSYYARELQQLLLEGLQLKSFKAFGVEKYDTGLIAAGKLYEYLQFNRKGNLPQLRSIQAIQNGEYMILDEATIRNLELISPLRDGNQQKTLYGVLNSCLTPMGQRRLRQWLLRPLINKYAIDRRLNAVSEILANTQLTSEITKQLDEVNDMERILAKLASRSANARDLQFLSSCTTKAINVIEIIKNNFETKYLRTYINEDVDLKELQRSVVNIIDNSIKEEPAITITEGNIIKAGYDENLDSLISEVTIGKEYIKNLEHNAIKETGINSLKVRFNKVFGYYIEVSKSNIGKVPTHYIRKQTTVNAERYITEDLKKWEEKVLGAEEKINQLEFELFEKLRQQILKQMLQLQQLFDCIANIDVLHNFAKLTQTRNYVKPAISEDMNDKTLIIEGRHPVVETFLNSTFIANDTVFDSTRNEMLILTGPNMSGKSTYIRQVALIFLMAQIGCFVSATKADIVITDRIFTRVGASDNLAGGESTFMVEMSETANILNNATTRSLIILDEVGRGTSTYDGVAIAWSIVEYIIKKISARTLFATHYHELILLEDLFEKVKNYNVQVLEIEGEVSFMHKIVKGGIDKSYGIHVAGLAGVPQTVVSRAVKILEQLQKRSIKTVAEKQNINNLQYGLLTENDSRVNEQTLALLQDILKIDINNISPIEALTKLQYLQETANAIARDNK